MTAIPRLWLAALLLSLAACAAPTTPSLRIPGLTSSVWTAVPPASAPAPTLPPAVTLPAPPDWIAVADGVERREFPIAVPGAGLTETLILFRLDPAAVAFRVHYTPAQAQFLSAWAAALRADTPVPLLVFNAGFFDEFFEVTAFTVADGLVHGASYHGFGGMFAVQNGVPRVRSLTVEPWHREEVFEQAVQGTPMLVRPGRTPYTTPDAQRSRRTAIGQTSDGAIVVVIAPTYSLRLVELSAALLDPGLDLDIALNLDGGSSTGYWAGPADRRDSDQLIPAVIAVYPVES